MSATHHPIACDISRSLGVFLSTVDGTMLDKYICTSQTPSRNLGSRLPTPAVYIGLWGECYRRIPLTVAVLRRTQISPSNTRIQRVAASFRWWYDIASDIISRSHLIRSILSSKTSFQQTEPKFCDKIPRFLVSFVVKRTPLASETRDKRLRGLSMLSAGGILDSSSQVCFA